MKRPIFKKPASVGAATFFVVILTILVLCSISPMIAQQKYPALTRTITYEELLKGAKLREMEWTDPNDVHEKMTITEMAIPVNEKMIQATRNFMLANYGLDSLWLNPKLIVFHAMGDGDLRNSLEVSSFLNDRIPESWGQLSRAGSLPNGAHFIVEKNGNIICLTPPRSFGESRISYERNNHHWLIKRHQDCNPLAIGIENVTDQENYTDLTSQQIESNARLARWLLWMENNTIEYLTSHHQFDDDKNYDLFLATFNLRHLQKKYRTTGRKDIGDKNLRDIIEKVNSYGYSVRSFFDLQK